MHFKVLKTIVISKPNKILEMQEIELYLIFLLIHFSFLLFYF